MKFRYIELITSGEYKHNNFVKTLTNNFLIEPSPYGCNLSDNMTKSQMIVEAEYLRNIFN